MATSPPTAFVTKRADSRCEYCHAPQVVTGITFHVEHIIPRARGGADDRSNLALACINCNGHKSNHVAGHDPETGAEVPLFHPREDKWKRHFRFVAATLKTEGITPTGRTTLSRLRMNKPKQLQARELWVELGVYP